MVDGWTDRWTDRQIERYTVLPLLRGHPFCRAKAASQEGWPLVRGKGLRESEG